MTDARAVDVVGRWSATGGSEVLLRVSHVWKRFPGVVALEDVSFEVVAGEVHALLGENGAGKSTLMAVASGSIAPDSGSIELCGWPAGSLTPSEALRHGLAIVRQHPAVLPDLTVAENLQLGVPRELRRGAARGWIARELGRVGLDVDVRARLDELTVAERQLVELAKALAVEPRVLILDEPTAALAADRAALVFEQVRAAAARGAAVVYISHRLPEVRQIADRLTVMRDGGVRITARADRMTDAEILRQIVGRPVSLAFPAKEKPRDGAGPGLTVRGLSGPGFHDVNLTVAPGEIVGLAGIEGNGQSELLRALAGLSRTTGEARLGDRPLEAAGPRGAGIAYLPADRHGEGLMMSLSVRENAAATALGRFATLGVVRRPREVAAVDREREALAIRAPSLETRVSALSGGNQQKVVLARALLTSPSLLLADEPTQGVDAGARVEIYRILREVAARGVPVLVVSSDGLELEGLCDRVAVFSRGQVVGELGGEDVTEARIGRAIVMANVHGHEDDGRRQARLRRLAGGDHAPGAVLLLVIAAIVAYTAAQNDHYLGLFNLSSMLTLLAALAFVSLGQLTVILTGGIDLSVGPLTGLLVVVASFFVVDGRSPLVMAAGFGLMLVVALATGLVNGLLVRVGRLTAVAATLATYIALQGISLVLRPFQGGYISGAVTDAITTRLGPVPVAFLAAMALAVLLEVGLRRTRWGRSLRAAGSDEGAAHQLGVRVGRVVVGAYVAASALTFLGGVMLMAQLGIGDPTQGVTFTLSSITAVVLGGASLFGGRGAFTGALLGAALIQVITNASTFLNLSQAWQYWFLGLLTLAGAVIYSQARRVSRAD